MRSILALLIALALPGTAAAQILFSPEPVAACMEKARTAGDRAACIGRAAEACRAATRGATEVDAATCLNGETEWWQLRLEEAHARMKTRAALLDVEHARSISQGAPKLTDDLALFQAAWKDWSERRCFFEAMLLRGRPDRMVKASDCMLRVTAEQALLLDEAAERR